MNSPCKVSLSMCILILRNTRLIYTDSFCIAQGDEVRHRKICVRCEVKPKDNTRGPHGTCAQPGHVGSQCGGHFAAAGSSRVVFLSCPFRRGSVHNPPSDAMDEEQLTQLKTLVQDQVTEQLAPLQERLSSIVSLLQARQEPSSGK